MNSLAIDTASTSGSIALMKDDKIIACQYMDIQITHSERLMPQIEQLFFINKMKAFDLDNVLIANGPGSFTGVRIGLSSAKGICYAIEKPLIPFNNLELLAINLYHTKLPILSVIDARMNEVYFALFDENLNEMIKPKNSSIDELVDQMNVNEIILIGDPLPELISKLKVKGINIYYPLVHQNLPLASALFSLYYLKKIKPVWDFEFLSELEPNYLRASIAQINRNKVK